MFRRSGHRFADKNMRHKRVSFMPRMRTLLAGSCLVLAAGTAAALERPPLQSACAAWDLHIVTLIEQVGEIEPASLRLAAATLTVQLARDACRNQDAATAMRLYESIDLRPPSRALQPVSNLY
jgi:hypothetical protein